VMPTSTPPHDFMAYCLISQAKVPIVLFQLYARTRILVKYNVHHSATENMKHNVRYQAGEKRNYVYNLESADSCTVNTYVKWTAYVCNLYTCHIVTCFCVLSHNCGKLTQAMLISCD
jgi:hypothetical protein